MLLHLKTFCFISAFILLVTSVPQQFAPSSKYFAAGLFDIATAPFTTSTASTVYSVTFSGYTRSSNNFKVGFSLHSIDIKFNNLKLQFDLKVQSTSTSGFTIAFSSSQANLITFMKICYVTKDPSYTQIFYIDTFRYSGSSFLVGNDSTTQANKTSLYPLSASLPVGSLSNIIDKTFLNAWNIDSMTSGIENHIDIFPTASFPSENIIQIKMQTIRSIIQVFFYSVTVVYFQSTLPYAQPLTSQVQPNALTKFFVDLKQATAPGASSMSITSPLQMFDYNTMVGMRCFHSRTRVADKFLNFKTVFSSNTVVTFPSLNVQNIEYLRFELMVWYQKICPSTDPYFVLYLADCVVACPTGYTIDSSKNCIADLKLNLNYVLKVPESNKIEVLFTVEPNEVSYNNLYTQINWNNTINTDIQTTLKTVQYLQTPRPQLKLTLEYTEDLESQDKNLFIQPYSSQSYPINFKGFEAKTVKLSSMTSINNLAIKKYPDSSYRLRKVTSYLSMALSALYMVTFLCGFGMGKVYVLQMAFVPQVTFISLIGLNNISPSMTGLGFLKYIFGYSYTQFSADLNIDQNFGQGQNYMSLIEVSNHFIYNYNIMFVFNIIAFVLFIIFYIKECKGNQIDHKQGKDISDQIQQVKAYQFFAYDTFLYLVLWFGLWIIFAGQIQISSLIKSISSEKMLDYIGIAFFSLNLVLYLGYLICYIRKFQRINSFKQCLKLKNPYEEQKIFDDKKKFFYLIYFVQKLSIASIFAFLNSIKFVNCIILGLHLVLIILLIIFRPYKIKDQQSQNNSYEQSTIKQIIRPLLNYAISSIIQILFFITNQIQSEDFKIYVPLIILCLLLAQLVATAVFLIKDQIVKKDLVYLTKIFKGEHKKKRNKEKFSQVANQTPKQNIDANQIKIQLLQKNPQNNLNSSKAINSRHNYQNQNQKTFNQRSQKSDDTDQMRIPKTSATKFDYQNYFEKMNQPKVPKDNLSIDQMLQIMAQKNHIRQLNNEKLRTMNQMTNSAQKGQDKIKKQKVIEEKKKKNQKNQKKQPQVFKLKSEWQILQQVDSSRMDKLIAFAAKKKEENFTKRL